ncbi:class I SAM-dependent methyltransferase [candidate division WOR-3 bacterium]|nr:class I SAM-dependent methyltransferase [candidate division WOR-3 bacterium]
MPIRNSPCSPGRWGDEDFVRVWDKRPSNPLKLEQLDILAATITQNWRRGARILDLGCGTGKIEERILEQLPVARFVCVDRSEMMLKFARKRLAAYAQQCRFVCADLGRTERLELPDRPFRFIILVDVVHELTDPAKRRLLRFCRKNLAPDGMLLFIDRIALDLENLRSAHTAVLRRLQSRTGIRTGQLSGCFADSRHRDHEHPLALEPYLRLFRACGFAPAVLHLHFHKVLFAARPIAPSKPRRP